MKKVILGLVIFVVVNTCFVTSVIAVPKITEIQGGFGVTATVLNAKGYDWRIGIRGTSMISGMITEGTITSKTAIIKTPSNPPALGIGKITIRVTIYRLILPDVIEVRTALMLGPFVLFVQPIPT